MRKRQWLELLEQERDSEIEALRERQEQTLRERHALNSEELQRRLREHQNADRLRRALEAQRRAEEKRIADEHLKPDLPPPRRAR